MIKENKLQFTSNCINRITKQKRSVINSCY